MRLVVDEGVPVSMRTENLEGRIVAVVALPSNSAPDSPISSIPANAPRTHPRREFFCELLDSQLSRRIFAENR